MGKVKLKKKIADNQGSMPKGEFVAKYVKIVKSDDVIAPDEEEVTTLDNLKAAKNLMLMDKKAFRGGLQRLDELKGGAVGMSAEEKMYVGTRFAFANPVDLISEFPDIRDRISNGVHTFHTPAVESRKKRFRYASSIIYNTVDPAVVPSVIDVFITPVTAQNISLWTSYTEFGIEGTQFGDGDGIMDYIRSTGAWTGTGLREAITGNLQVVPGNLTVDEILDAIENVLIDGIYDIP